MLVVASDRISVFDVVLPDAIPDKGRVLTALSTFWFEQTAAPVRRTTWCRPTPPTSPRPPGPTSRAGRCSCARREPVRLECIARGYLFGSAWTEYEEHGHGARAARCRPGCARPSGCPSRSSRPPPRPTSGHDVPLTDAEAAALVGDDVFEQVRDRDARGLRVRRPRTPATRASSSPTPSSSSAMVDGELLVIDEMLTPDSSRYWPADEYAVGHARRRRSTSSTCATTTSSLGWDQTPPAPPLPPSVIDGHAGALRRGLRAAHRRELRRAGTDRMRSRRYHRRVRFEAQVDVTHLPGVLDPQGATVERALPALGYDERDARCASARRSGSSSTPTERSGRARAGRRDVPAPARQPGDRGATRSRSRSGRRRGR